eukprot:9702001-Karenia_brevis.AAC.1
MLTAFNAMLPFLTAPQAIQAFNGLIEHLGSLLADAMPDHTGHASPVHRDEFADTSRCGLSPQLEPLHYSNMPGQPNHGCDCSVPGYAPGTWEVDTMKVEALWSQHDIAIAQATSACKKWEVSEHHKLQTSGGPMEDEKFEQLVASPFQHWPACV